MDNHLGSLLDEIHSLERAVAEKINQAEKSLTYELEHGRAVFRPDVLRRHKAIMKRAWRTLTECSFLTIATAPFIYALIFPFSMLDLFVSVYQAVCFPVYRIPKVSRSNFIVVDRQTLAYLNVIEKVNCVFCGYCNGVLAFAREVAARTEKYWCPIKHGIANGKLTVDRSEREG